MEYGRLKKLVAAIDRVTALAWKIVCWTTLIMVLVGSFNALARYGGDFLGVQLSSNAYLELQWYLFGVVFLIGAAPTLKQDGHVRVDVIYSRLSDRRKAWVNLIGAALFVIPFCLMMLWATWHTVWNSWAGLEWSSNSDGLPRYPIKSILPISFVLLLAQGFASAIRQIIFLRRDSSPVNRESDA